MNDSIPVSSLETLADALRTWRSQFEDPDYRRSRVTAVGELLSRQELRRDVCHIRLLVDRTIEIDSNFDAWICDQWHLWPYPEPMLLHGAAVLVCQAGLTEIPIPDSEALEIGGSWTDESLGARVWHIKDVSPGWSDIALFQCFVADSPSRYKGRPQRSPLPFRTRSSIRVNLRLGRTDVVAQLCLLALRQEVAGQDALDWLANHSSANLAPEVRDHIPAAVDHAVTHFVVPVGSAKRYIRTVARGMAREGIPPLDVQQQVAALDVSVRSLYRWRSKCPEEEVANKAESLHQKRLKSALARLVADSRAISYDAARMLIARRLKKGLDLEEAARQLLDLDTSRRVSRE